MNGRLISLVAMAAILAPVWIGETNADDQPVTFTFAVHTTTEDAARADQKPTEAAAAAAHGLTEETGDMTYYDLGLTACGQTYTNADMVAALAFDWFTTPNPNEDPMCGRRVRITDPATSNTVEVEIRDKCQACQHGDIDVSPTAFQTLQPLDVGRYKVTWDFI